MRDIPRGARCQDDSCDANHCPMCGGHKLDWYAPGLCEQCQIVDQHDDKVLANIAKMEGKAYGIYKSDPIKRDDPEHAQDKDAQHTPGPWIDRPGWLDPHLTKGQMRFRHNITAGAHCPAQANGYTPAEAAANARLIAAAPDLLDACNAITSAFIHIPGDEKGNKVRTEIFRHCENMRQAAVKVRSAIAKAQGN